MAISQPISTDKLNNPDHSLLHRQIATDPSAPVKSIQVNADGTVTEVLNTASGAATQSQGNNSTKIATTAYVDTGLGTKVKNDGSVNPTNLLFNGDFELWTLGTAVAPDGWTLYGDGASAREGNIVKEGTYAHRLTATVSGSLGQDFKAKRGMVYWQGRKVTFGAWVYCDTANKAKLAVYDDIATSNSPYHTGNSTWQWLTVTHTIGAAATIFYPYFNVASGAPTSAYIDEAICVEGESIFAFNDRPLIPGTAFIPGAITMYPHVNQTVGANGSDAWTVLGPYGEPISTANTTTQGLQEAINYAWNSGRSLWVFGTGPGTPSPGTGLLSCYSTIVIGSSTVPFQQCSEFHFVDVNLGFSTGGSNDGLKITNIGIGGIYITGQIIYDGTGAAVAIRGETGLGGGTLILEVQVICAQYGTCVEFDNTYSGYGGSRFKFGEINGQTGVNSKGLVVTGSFPFLENIIDVGVIHDCKAGGLLISDASQNNIWNIGTITVNDGDALNTYGSNDTFNIRINGSTGVDNGIVINPGANNNIFVIRSLIATGATEITDNGTGNIMLGSGKMGIGIAASNANAILDLTSTTKAFMPPRMTTTQRDAVASPTEGMVVYNLTTHVLNFYNASAWGAV